MKYIRTKDRIYKKDKVSIVKENDVELVILGICDDFIERTRGKTWNYGTNVIIKQADDIAELCDEFVYITSKNKKIIERYFSHNNGIEIINVYGAIWTDKGLIYVAKMNDKGYLELL